MPLSVWESAQECEDRRDNLTLKIQNQEGEIIMKNRDWVTWTKKAGVRAIKTMAQTAVAMLPAAATIGAVDWMTVAGTAALAGVASLLTSLKGLPELEEQNDGKN